MKVELLDHMGSDLTVVNAARVSFDKESEWERQHWNPVTREEDVELRKLSDRDTKLIRYLAEHEHWSPFAHPQASFRVSAPVFVARQLQKHTVGLAWNEVSRRYVDSEPTFYTPETWRKRAENVKQGSSDEAVLVVEQFVGHELAGEDEHGHYYDKKYMVVPVETRYNEAVQNCFEAYEEMLTAGVCPEQARMVLPQSMMTEWIWTGSLYAFARVCKLRLDSHTQKETRFIAEEISKHMASLFPCSWSCLVRQPGSDPNQGN